MKSSGPDLRTREKVSERAGGCCERCGRIIMGGWGYSLHHRKPRRMGGTRRIDINLPSNLLLLCGSGTTGCHQHVESNRADSYQSGYILYDRDNPAEIPYRDITGAWWTLTPEGTREPSTTPQLGYDDPITHPQEGNTVTTTQAEDVTTSALAEVRSLTNDIRQHQRNIEELSRMRRTVIMGLRDKRVTYREISEAMGTTEQNVYKILRDYIAEQHARKAAAAAQGHD